MKDNENIITLRFISSHALYFSVRAQLRTYEATYRISKMILFNEAETKKQQQQQHPACWIDRNGRPPKKERNKNKNQRTDFINFIN